jgi:hypothetical protein
MSEFPIRRPHVRTGIVSKSAKQAADHANMDLPTVIAFSLIAGLLALNVMLRFHEIGVLVTQYNQF